MDYRALVGLTCMCLANVSRGQNLVPNGDFEVFSLCPSAISQIQYAQPWFNARTGAPNGPGATPDYFNVCATSSIVDVPTNCQGNQLAQSGDAYAGVVTYLGGTADFREYAEVELIQPLVGGMCYELSFYMSLGESPTNATVDGIGAYFSNGIAVQASNSAMTVTPQLDQLGSFLTDSIGWLQVSGTYEAVGGESYMTLGNFHDDANTTVTQLHPSIYLPNCYFYIDQVSLMAIPVGCGPLGTEEMGYDEVKIYPNPARDAIEVRISSGVRTKVELVNAAGQTVFVTSLLDSTRLDVSHFSPGVYTCVVSSDSGLVNQRTLILISGS